MRKQLLWAAGLAALAASAPSGGAERGYSQPAEHDVPRRVFWGDTHLHTRMSADAYSMGNTTHTPEQAFRFARGETVVAQNGMKARLRQPLDFLVVSDHAEYLGIMSGVEDEDPAVLSSSVGEQAYKLLKAGKFAESVAYVFGAFTGQGSRDGKRRDVEPEVRQSVWQGVGERADRFNTPGRFTAFVGYEYTASLGLRNLHRVVIFRDGSEKTSRILPFSAIDSQNPEDLWSYLAEYEKDVGGAVFAIPHNSNGSGGSMFETVQFNGDPITAQYARTRIRWEPIAEVTQIKGDSETHPILSPEDEFADYETWLSITDHAQLPGNMPMSQLGESLPGSYLRSALQRGLQIEQEVGVNPYKLGMIGSSDAHTALPAVEEDNFWGKMGSSNPSADRWKLPWGPADPNNQASSLIIARFKELGVTLPENWPSSASGLAAVWARENTREALFDSMRRKEVYATTGTRMTVRFFGGWDYADNADKRRDYVDIGYDGGVPMGGDLTKAASGKKPKFLVLAAKDPDGANLDRVQVIKGWVDAKGKSHEKVYDVAWSDGRKKDARGKVPAVGSTVDLKTATYTNTIGAPILSTVWTDPDFDAGQRAFYYVRVLEIPTPRWTDYDAAFYKVTIPDFVPMTTQERAYTSPIWYTP